MADLRCISNLSITSQCKQELPSFVVNYSITPLHTPKYLISSYITINLGCSVILFPLSPTSLYFSHFLLELLLIYIASQLKYRLVGNTNLVSLLNKTPSHSLVMCRMICGLSPLIMLSLTSLRSSV